ncbi:Ig-like domain-containing protein [Nibrella saemangeumensis]|uniref:Ig-like domain-containing protein n=1 Tax=Nibrella saemangeumensis TaxID=1084526 RepID=A0ABP8MV07_9BACT
MAQPPGGKKDSLAPVLLKSIPESKQTNFKGREIELFFNEYISVENLPQKVIVTPGTGLTFNYKIRPTSVYLKFNEPFKDNTTYTVSFTDAIKDATERNPATNLKLVFSTGTQLDSLSVSGKVTDLKTGKVVADALVGLYAVRDTLNALKEKPIYYSKTDTSGNFLMENIRAGGYELLAFNDANNNFLFNQQNERIGFLKDSINLTGNINGVELQLFSQNNSPAKISRTESRQDSYGITLDKGIERYQVNFRRKEDSIPSILASANQIKFFRNRATPDTIGVVLTVVDSIGTSTDLKQTLSFRDRSRRDKAEPFTAVSEPPQNDAVEKTFNWTLTFTKPVGRINKQLITILSDSTSSEEFDEGKIQWSNGQSMLSYPINSSARKDIRISLEEGAFMSVLEDSLKKTVFTYRILNPEDFGLLKGQVVSNAPNYIVELVNESGKVISREVNSKTYTFRNVRPGRYRLRLVIDRNNNGRWDTGNYQLKQEAEPIIYYPSIIQAKADFQFEGVDLEYSEKVNSK